MDDHVYMYFLLFLTNNLTGEWWKEDVIKVEKDAYLAGNVPIKSDAFTINGMPGDLYPCPSKIFYLLYIIETKYIHDSAFLKIYLFTFLSP